MPSPLAHASVAFVLWPALRRGGVDRASLPRQALLGGMLVTGLLGPDIDFLTHLVLPEGSWTRHGGAFHSLGAALIFGLVFATVGARLVPVAWGRLYIVGAAAWASHAVLDIFTARGGVELLWPLTGQRFSAPFPLFYGVRHSDPWAFDNHMLTVLTELPFVFLMLFAGWWLSCRWAPPPEDEMHDGAAP